VETSKPSIFDGVDRVDPRPQRHLETWFEFMNRITGDYWQQVRELVQEWADALPDDDYMDLRGRLRRDDGEAFSAFLELFIHETLRRAGYEITVHPQTPGNDKRPDFLARRDDIAFYIEATMPGARPEVRARANRRAAFLDTINEGTNRDFHLTLERLTVGPNSAPGKAVRGKIDAWLATLPLDAEHDDYESRERFRWAEDGWEAEFSVIRISAQYRGRPNHRSIGAYADGEVEWIDDATSIKASLRSKARAYGELDLPLVLSVGTFIWDRDRWHATNAFFGHEAIQWHEDDDGQFHTRVIRHPDGFFGAPPEWANEQVAAVLHINQLQPHRPHRAEVNLWHHPSPTSQLPPDLGIPSRILRLDGARIDEAQSSVPSEQHLGLPDEWPIGEAWPDEE